MTLLTTLALLIDLPVGDGLGKARREWTCTVIMYLGLPWTNMDMDMDSPRTEVAMDRYVRQLDA